MDMLQYDVKSIKSGFLSGKWIHYKKRKFNFIKVLLKKVLFYVVVAIFLTSFVFLVIRSNQWSKGLKIQKLEVFGTSYLDDSEITRDYQDLINKEIEVVDLNEIENELSLSPFVQNVSAEIDYDRLLLKIEERFPTCYFLDGDEMLMISNDMEIMPNREISGRTDLPVIRTSKKIIDKEKSDLSKFFAKTKENLLWRLSSELLIDESGLTIVCTERKINIVFGKLDFIDEKINNFNEFWNYYVSGKISKQFKNIDLRWMSRVVLS
jgi:hypothetical protein